MVPMTDLLALAESRLLAPGGLAVATLDRAFARLLGPGVDDGDLYFQHARREGWTIEDGIVKHGAHSIDQGVGVRWPVSASAFTRRVAGRREAPWAAPRRPVVAGFRSVREAGHGEPVGRRRD